MSPPYPYLWRTSAVAGDPTLKVWVAGPQVELRGDAPLLNPLAAALPRRSTQRPGQPAATRCFSWQWKLKWYDSRLFEIVDDRCQRFFRFLKGNVLGDGRLPVCFSGHLPLLTKGGQPLAINVAGTARLDEFFHVHLDFECVPPHRMTMGGMRTYFHSSKCIPDGIKPFEMSPNRF